MYILTRYRFTFRDWPTHSRYHKNNNNRQLFDRINHKTTNSIQNHQVVLHFYYHISVSLSKNKIKILQEHHIKVLL